MRVARLAVVPVLLLALAACPASTGLRPGASSQFDAAAFDTLLVAQAALEEAKTVAVTRDEVLAVNAAIAAYNAAERTYRIYHEAAKAGPADVAALAVQLAGLVELVLPWLDPAARAELAPWLNAGEAP